jgi:hypothetical protein
MGGLFAADWDALVAKLQTANGLIRDMRRQTKGVAKEFTAESEALDHYAQAIRSQDKTTVMISLVAKNKGYLVLLRNEFERLFKELHDLIKEYNKLHEQVVKILKEFENEFARIQIVDNRLEQNKLFHKTVKIEMNYCLNIVENAFEKLILTLGSMGSFSITTSLRSFVLDPWAQQQVEMGDLKKARKEFSEFKSNVRNVAAKKILAEHDADQRLKDFSLMSTELKKELEEVVTDLNKVRDDVIQLLQNASGKLQKIISKDGVVVRLRDLTKDNVPSLPVLDAPRPIGYGFHNKEYAHLKEETDRIQAYYKDELNKLVSEARIFISKVEHSKAA